MTETAAPQIFTGASRFDISNSVFIATSNPTTVSNIANETRPTISDPYILSSSRSNIIEEEKDDDPPVESELYARLLLPRKKGYPLWKPKPDENLPEDYRRFGVRIGDVGFLGDGGGFEYLFNACHPADHPINLHRVPRDFEPLLTINDRDISGSTQEYSPGDHVPSSFSHIFKYRILYTPGEPPVMRVSPRVGAGFKVRSSAPKGALLILPEGGSKADHHKLNEFRAYAAKHAQSWYAHVNGPMARGVHNGAIYFVTGFDKARAWGVASFIDAKPSNISLEFVPSKSARRGGPPEYWFRTSHAASSSSDADDVFENPSGCIFLRGFKIAVRILPFKTEVGTTVSYISNLETEDLLPKPKSTGFYVPPPQWWLTPYLVPRTSPGSTSQNWQMTEGESSGSDFPIRYPVYHPSDVINQWILSLVQSVPLFQSRYLFILASKDKDIDTAITHDSEWAELISEASYAYFDFGPLTSRLRPVGPNTSLFPNPHFTIPRHPYHPATTHLPASPFTTPSHSDGFDRPPAYTNLNPPRPESSFHFDVPPELEMGGFKNLSLTGERLSALDDESPHAGYGARIEGSPPPGHPSSDTPFEILRSSSSVLRHELSTKFRTEYPSFRSPVTGQAIQAGKQKQGERSSSENSATTSRSAFDNVDPGFFTAVQGDRMIGAGKQKQDERSSSENSATTSQSVFHNVDSGYFSPVQGNRMIEAGKQKQDERSSSENSATTSQSAFHNVDSGYFSPVQENGGQDFYVQEDPVIRAGKQKQDERSSSENPATRRSFLELDEMELPILKGDFFWTPNLRRDRKDLKGPRDPATPDVQIARKGKKKDVKPLYQSESEEQTTIDYNRGD